MNYAARLPLEKNNVPYMYISAVSQQSQKGQPAVSSVITLSPNTTAIEISALGGQSSNSAIIGKWGTASVTSSNFDWCVQAGQSKLFAVPITTTNAPPASIAGANASNGLFSAVAVTNATATLASVLSVEYT